MEAAAGKAGDTKLRVLVVGGGGREHALARAIARSPMLDALWVAPGNVGMRDVAQLLPHVDAESVDSIVSAAVEVNADLVVIGPEVALVRGAADALRERGIAVFGPSAAAAELEGSKTFTKDFMQRHNIPTAWYGKFDGRGGGRKAADAAQAAKTFVRARGGTPIVIKADGLAAGKGVIIAKSLAEADAAIDAMMLENAFGEAGMRIVVEECLVGEEASFFALVQGERAVALGSAQDHKAVGEGDTGPNTGGMGAYSPAPVVTERVHRELMERVVLPTARGMAKEGRAFSGVLFVGAMITAAGVKVLEYNVRFGDPECQVLLTRLRSDLLPTLLAVATGAVDLGAPELRDDVAAMVVVLASRGYPGDYSAAKRSVIRGIDAANAMPGVFVYHAGTAAGDSKDGSEATVIATGGRVLGVTAEGPSIADARHRSYAAIDHAIEWPEGFCRRDIGWRALAHQHDAEVHPRTSH